MFYKYQPRCDSPHYKRHVIMGKSPNIAKIAHLNVNSSFSNFRNRHILEVTEVLYVEYYVCYSL